MDYSQQKPDGVMARVLHDVVELIACIVDNGSPMYCHLYYPVLDSLDFLVELCSRNEWRGIDSVVFGRNLEVVSQFLTGVSTGTTQARRRHPEACRVIQELGIQARCLELSRAMPIMKGGLPEMRSGCGCP